MSASGNLRRTAADLAALPRVAVTAAAGRVEQIAADEGRRAGGPLQGKPGRRPLPLIARTVIRPGASDASTAVVQGADAGAWAWRTTGTKPHRIRRRTRGPMARMTIRHPGSAGVDAWGKVRRRAARDVPTVIAAAVSRVVG